MADPFIAEIRINGFNFAPTGWAFCNGQILPISQNTALFSLLGTTYGGNGQTTFALPNLQDRSPMHPGQGPGLSLHDLGESAGTSTVSLLVSELPAHTHTIQAGTAGTASQAPGGNSLAASPAKAFHPGPPDAQLAGDALQVAGQGFPHNNMPPYLALNFCIAMQGIFPTRP